MTKMVRVDGIALRKSVMFGDGTFSRPSPEHFVLGPKLHGPEGYGKMTCPTCRAGQLDLIGVRLKTLTNSNYSAIRMALRFLLKYHTPVASSSSSFGTLAGSTTTSTTASTSASTSTTASTTTVVADEKEKLLSGLTPARRELLLEQWARISRNQHQISKDDANLFTRLTEEALAEDCCPFCRKAPSASASQMTRTIPDTEALLRQHVFICRKRTFECPFADCKLMFGWDKVYPTSLPPKAYFGETLWWSVLNAGFVQHMKSGECKHQHVCTDHGCEKRKLAPMPMPLAFAHAAFHAQVNAKLKCNMAPLSEAWNHLATQTETAATEEVLRLTDEIRLTAAASIAPSVAATSVLASSSSPSATGAAGATSSSSPLRREFVEALDSAVLPIVSNIALQRCLTRRYPDWGFASSCDRKFEQRRS